MLCFICTVASTYSLTCEWQQRKAWPEEFVLVWNAKKIKILGSQFFSDLNNNCWESKYFKNHIWLKQPNSIRGSRGRNGNRHSSCCYRLYDVSEVTLPESFYLKIINKTTFIINIQTICSISVCTEVQSTQTFQLLGLAAPQWCARK